MKSIQNKAFDFDFDFKPPRQTQQLAGGIFQLINLAIFVFKISQIMTGRVLSLWLRPTTPSLGCPTPPSITSTTHQSVLVIPISLTCLITLSSLFLFLYFPCHPPILCLHWQCLMMTLDYLLLFLLGEKNNVELLCLKKI